LLPVLKWFITFILQPFSHSNNNKVVFIKKNKYLKKGYKIFKEKLQRWSEMFMKLTPDKLKKNVDLSSFDFETTSEIEPLTTIIGQERAKRAFEFGLSVTTKGYNIYMCGPTGTGKTSFAENYLKEIAKNRPVPNDWVYVYNFVNPDSPIAISLQKEWVKFSKKDMADFLEFVINDLKKVLTARNMKMIK